MIKPIVLEGNPVLEQIAIPVELDKETSKIVKDLFKTLSQTDSGVGLAAPQIGSSTRIFVVNFNGFKEAFINPIIVEKDPQMADGWESCLSLPGKNIKVSRHIRCVVEYYDELFKFKKKSFENFTARVIQHEFDHLEGRLITGYITEKEPSV